MFTCLPLRGAQDYCFLVLCPIDINPYKRRGGLFMFSALRCRGFYCGCVLGHSWEEVVKGKSLAVWHRVYAALIHGEKFYFLFLMQHFCFSFLCRRCRTLVASLQIQLLCNECQIQRKTAEDFGRFHCIKDM